MQISTIIITHRGQGLLETREQDVPSYSVISQVHLMLQPNVSPLEATGFGWLSRPKTATPTPANKLRVPGKGRYLLWQEMKLRWWVITIHEGKLAKPQEMAPATVCSHLCGWLMKAWVRITAILTPLLCPPSFSQLVLSQFVINIALCNTCRNL